MKTIRIISALLIITQISVAQENKKAIAPKAYAEISVKQDGKWEGQKYIGGNFKNVSSMKQLSNKIKRTLLQLRKSLIIASLTLLIQF